MAHSSSVSSAGKLGNCLELRQTRLVDGRYAFLYKYSMRTTSCSELRRNLASLLDRVHDDREPLLITRDRGKPAAVLLSLEEFASYEETRHLLRSPRNAKRLLQAIDELNADGGSERPLIG